MSFFLIFNGKLLLSNFYQEVWVVCPLCAKKAMATVNFETKTAPLFMCNMVVN